MISSIFAKLRAYVDGLEEFDPVAFVAAVSTVLGFACCTLGLLTLIACVVRSVMRVPAWPLPLIGVGFICGAWALLIFASAIHEEEGL